MIEVLLQLGVAIDHTSNSGFTALALAALTEMAFLGGHATGANMKRTLVDGCLRLFTATEYC